MRASSRRLNVVIIACSALVSLLSVAVIIYLVTASPRGTAAPGPGGPGGTVAPGPGGPAGGYRYAYTTSAQLVLDSDRHERRAVAGDFGGPFWTQTGTFLVTPSRSTTGDEFLTLVEASSGTVQRLQCDCTGAAPAGDNRIAYVETPAHRLVTLDLAADSDPQPVAVTLPAGLQVVEVMAGAAGAVLLRTRAPGAEQDPMAKDVLFAVSLAGGRATKAVEHAFIVGSSAVAGAGPDGRPRFAITIPADDGRCVSSKYLIFDPSTGASTNPPSMVPSAPGETAWMTIWDWWWDARGALTASISAHRCGAIGAEMTAPPTLFRLDGDHWTSVDKTVGIAQRPLGGDAWLQLQDANGHDASLYLRNGRERAKVADQVRSLAVAPAVAPPLPSRTAVTIDGQLLRRLGVCKVPCTVTGLVEFDHPAWGRTKLVTTKARGSGDVEADIAAVDAKGAVRWSHFGGPWEKLAFADPPRDKTGHIFLNFNPGRYNGVIVLAPVTDGFADFATLPDPGDYRSRFYSADLVDVDHDGTYEVDSALNDCEPSCGQGTVHHTVYRWDGETYKE
nr:hypothetical protein GCM10020063_010480 [Dactylosporangium thailandense]